MNGCIGCGTTYSARANEISSLKERAKTIANENKVAQAICEDEATGFFIVDVFTAFKNNFKRLDIVTVS